MPTGVVTVTSTVPMLPAGLSAVTVVSLTTVTLVAAVVPEIDWWSAGETRPDDCGPEYRGRTGVRLLQTTAAAAA